MFEVCYLFIMPNDLIKLKDRCHWQQSFVPLIYIFHISVFGLSDHDKTKTNKKNH